MSKQSTTTTQHAKTMRYGNKSRASLLALLGLAVASISSLSEADGWVKLPKVKSYFDLNHVIESGMQTYPGLSLVSIFDWAPRFANSALIDEATLLGISGTYIDAPYHSDPNGQKISDYPLSKLANLPIVVIKKSTYRLSFEVSDFRGLDVKGKAVLLFSGHDKYFGTDQYGVNVPFLSYDAAKYLVAKGAALVGIDTPLIDDIASGEIPDHKLLLGNGIPICEDMTNLGALPVNGAYLTAVPPRVKMTSFPARVFATTYQREDREDIEDYSGH